VDIWLYFVHHDKRITVKYNQGFILIALINYFDEKAYIIWLYGAYGYYQTILLL